MSLRVCRLLTCALLLRCAASTVSQEDHEEFVGLLAKVFFQRGGHDTSNQDGVVLKVSSQAD